MEKGGAVSFQFYRQNDLTDRWEIVMIPLTAHYMVVEYENVEMLWRNYKIRGGG